MTKTASILRLSLGYCWVILGYALGNYTKFVLDWSDAQ